MRALPVFQLPRSLRWLLSVALLSALVHPADAGGGTVVFVKRSPGAGDLAITSRELSESEKADPKIQAMLQPSPGTFKVTAGRPQVIQYRLELRTGESASPIELWTSIMEEYDHPTRLEAIWSHPVFLDVSYDRTSRKAVVVYGRRGAAFAEVAELSRPGEAQATCLSTLLAPEDYGPVTVSSLGTEPVGARLEGSFTSNSSTIAIWFLTRSATSTYSTVQFAWKNGQWEKLRRPRF
jgi:hypothetical protein